ncbi:MAG: protein of unknown function (DUF4405) [Candidatus Electronema aureum]|uniref:Flavinylation-associated cytochrome domain-containing protein n=1 Tax=Candidatus Electronema aureum TaxID=2005002 RepID=A0A521FYB4_9BACT|nr:MAG: protein of unknown function (DUF4405) [Candidatus Electronema aureum]
MSIKREWTTPITAGSFLLLAVTGVFMFFHAAPGLAKEAHEWVSWIFLAAAAFHLAVNFAAFKKYLTERKGQVLVGAFALILLVSFAPVGGSGEPPFVAPLRALGKAPLTTLAQVAQTSPEQMIAQLKQEGLAVQSAQQSLSELVGDDLHKQTRFLKMLLDK